MQRQLSWHRRLRNMSWKYIQTQGVRAHFISFVETVLSRQNANNKKWLSVIPANEPEWAWPVSVHQDPKRKSGCAQQERADGEAEVQYLFLLHTTPPATALNGSPVGVDSPIFWIGSWTKRVREGREPNGCLGCQNIKYIVRFCFSDTYCPIDSMSR